MLRKRELGDIPFTHLDRDITTAVFSALSYEMTITIQPSIRWIKSQPPKTFAMLSRAGRRACQHAYSLWLFTSGDLKTIVIPKTTFGTITLLSGPVLTTSARLDPHLLVKSLPLIVLWIWINLLPLDMSNQCGKDAAMEDAINKPWRPIPAGRLTIDETKWLMVVAYVVAVISSFWLGGLSECLALVFEGWIYNRLGAADKSCLSRNILNAVGYVTFATGSARVACVQYGTTFNDASLPWLMLLGAVIASTIHFQDLYDQSGDKARGRRTIPLLMGDRWTRISITLSVAAWSLVCPAFWGLDVKGFIAPCFLCSVVILRLWLYRDVSSDKISFKIWNLWIIALYVLPMIKMATE